MAEVDFELQVSAFKKGLSRFQKRQIPFAAAKALSATAKVAKQNVEATLPQRIDRPTPFTMRGIVTVAASPRPGSERYLRSSVRVKDRQGGYLRYLERGGTRQPEGRAILVPYDYRTNRYGNLPLKRKGQPSVIERIKARNPDRIFTGVPKGRTQDRAGVWKRPIKGKMVDGVQRYKGAQKNLKLMIAFEPRAHYKKQLGFKKTVEIVAKRQFPGQFRKAFRDELKRGEAKRNK